MSNKRRAPADLAERAATMGIIELSLHYGCDRSVARRWLDEAGLKRSPDYSARTEKQQLSIPPGLRDLAAKMTNTQLQCHYRRHYNTVMRWLDEAGIPRRRKFGEVTAAPPKPKMRALPASERKLWPSAATPVVSGAIAAQAAQFLQKLGYVPVYHRAIHGQQFAGTYQVGRNVLVAEEMIARARGKGFDADGWRRLG